MSTPYDSSYEIAAYDYIRVRRGEGAWKSIFDFCSVSCVCPHCMLGDYIIHRLPVHGRMPDGIGKARAA